MSNTLTENEEKYLKLIYRCQVEDHERLRTTEIANEFGVRPATVTEALQKLAQKRILRYEPYRGVKLNNRGLAEARMLLRKHRLIETLLVNLLKFGVQEACREAGRLDHHTSKDLADKICRLYKHPRLCPCNKPITRGRGCQEVRS